MCVKSLLKFCGCIAVCSALLSTLCPLSAEAALSGGRYLTPSETVAVIGDSLAVTYFDGTENVTVTASYVGSDYARGIDQLYQSTDYFQTGLQTIVFRFSGNVVNNPQYIAVDFAPAFSLLNVDQVHTCIAISADNNSGISASVYQTPQWVWTMGGVSRTFEGRADYGMHYRAELTTSFAYGSYFDYVPVDWLHEGLTSAHSQRALFSYASPASDGYYYIVFGCPYITYDGSIDTVSGTTGTTSTGTGVNINVDMRETNSILSGIAQSILDGLAAIFVPSDEFLEDHIDSVHSRFGIFDSISDTWDTVTAAIQAQEWGSPPTVTANMANRSEGGLGFDYGGTVSVFDLSWYAEYKPLCDIIISAFLWMFFLWRLWARLPDIINGAGMTYIRVEDIDTDLKIRAQRSKK